jgi:hypothetical protein
MGASFRTPVVGLRHVRGPAVDWRLRGGVAGPWHGGARHGPDLTTQCAAGGSATARNDPRALALCTNGYRNQTRNLGHRPQHRHPRGAPHRDHGACVYGPLDGRNGLYAGIMLQETQRTSWQLIWREEMAERFTSVSKTVIDQKQLSQPAVKQAYIPENIETAPSELTPIQPEAGLAEANHTTEKQIAPKKSGIAMIRIFEIVGAVVGAGLLILSVRLDDMRQRSKQRRSGEANRAHLSDREEIAG